MSATRLTGLYSVVAAAAAVLFAPLLALAYFATGDRSARRLALEAIAEEVERTRVRCSLRLGEAKALG